MKKTVLILLIAALTVFGASLASAANTKSSKMHVKPAKVMMAPVHINSASLEQLETLPSIGPKIAADIIKYRPYKNAKSLESKVKGIGPKTWAHIKGKVSFN